MTLLTAIIMAATLFEDDYLFTALLRNDFGRNGQAVHVLRLVTVAGKKDVTKRDLVTRFTRQFFNCDFVSGGDAILLAACAHDCEHGFNSSVSKAYRLMRAGC